MDDLKAYAAQASLNTQQFNSCLDSGKYRAVIDAELQDGRQRGFQGTPTFLINNQVIVGPPSFDMLKQRIDQILSSGG